MICEKFSRIIQINHPIKDCNTSSFPIPFQNVVITRSSVVGEVVLFDGDCYVAKISELKAKNVSISYPGSLQNGSNKLTLWRIGPRSGRLSLAKCWITAVETTMNGLLAESSTWSICARKDERILVCLIHRFDVSSTKYYISSSRNCSRYSRNYNWEKTQLWRNYLTSELWQELMRLSMVVQCFLDKWCALYTTLKCQHPEH